MLARIGLPCESDVYLDEAELRGPRAAASRNAPLEESALLLASELLTNSVRHSGSAAPGGLVTVTVTVGDECVRVEITDRSGVGVPVLQPAHGSEAERSRWMRLVDALAARQGYLRGSGLATTWFEFRQD